jgi:hypothetical protein
MTPRATIEPSRALSPAAVISLLLVVQCDVTQSRMTHRQGDRPFRQGRSEARGAPYVSRRTASGVGGVALTTTQRPTVAPVGVGPMGISDGDNDRIAVFTTIP